VAPARGAGLGAGADLPTIAAISPIPTIPSKCQPHIL
jgi:hypothetical protein